MNRQQLQDIYLEVGKRFKNANRKYRRNMYTNTYGPINDEYLIDAYVALYTAGTITRNQLTDLLWLRIMLQDYSYTP